MLCLCTYIVANDDSCTIFLYVSVSESVSVKLSALYLVLKVSEKSGIDPPLVIKPVDNLDIMTFAIFHWLNIVILQSTGPYEIYNPNAWAVPPKSTAK